MLTSSASGIFDSLLSISFFAFLVNVIARIFSGLIDLYLIRNSIRLINTDVFPDPAPAIQRILLFGEVIAFFCSKL